jgi:hypothetical protein
LQISCTIGPYVFDLIVQFPKDNQHKCRCDKFTKRYRNRRFLRLSPWRRGED